MRVLGVNCTTRDAYLAVAEDGRVLAGLTERLQMPAGLEAGEALVEFVDAVSRVLREIGPDRIEVLLPETWTASYRQHLDRAVLETLIRLGAAHEDVASELIARPTLRSRLGLPRKGALDSHIAAAGDPTGRYWTVGRGLAALAALAGGTSDAASR